MCARARTCVLVRVCACCVCCVCVCVACGRAAAQLMRTHHQTYLHPRTLNTFITFNDRTPTALDARSNRVGGDVPPNGALARYPGTDGTALSAPAWDALFGTYAACNASPTAITNECTLDMGLSFTV